MPTFAPMNDPRYHITAINVLTRERESISRPMSETEAKQRLERELLSRKNQRYKAHTRLRVDRLEPVQLTIKFDENE